MFPVLNHCVKFSPKTSPEHLSQASDLASETFISTLLSGDHINDDRLPYFPWSRFNASKEKQRLMALLIFLSTQTIFDCVVFMSRYFL